MLETLSSLGTTLEASDDYNGNLFDLRTFAGIFISHFEISLSSSTKNITYEIFTKTGTYRGYEKSLNHWTLLTQDTITGIEIENLFATKYFNPELFIASNTTQAYYISLSEPKLRTFEGTLEGLPSAVDSNIEIQEGAAIMGIGAHQVVQSECVFNGVIHYRVEISEEKKDQEEKVEVKRTAQLSSHTTNSTKLSTTHPMESVQVIAREREHSEVSSVMSDEALSFHPKSEISSEKLSNRTIASKTKTAENTYEFEIHHSPDSDSQHIFDQIKTSIRNTLTSIFEASGKQELKVLSVESKSITHESYPEAEFCLSVEKGNQCSLIKSIVSVSYGEHVSGTDVQSSLLEYGVDISKNLGFPYVAYIGMQPIFARIELKISGPQIDEIDSEKIELFERKTSAFLNAFFAENDFKVYIMNTKLLDQEKDLKSELLDDEIYNGEKNTTNNRYLGQSEEDEQISPTIIILMSINGEYQQPPVIDLYKISKKAFEEKKDVFITDINKECFADGVEHMEVYENAKTYIFDSEFINDHTEASFNWTYLYALLGLILVPIVMLFFGMGRKNKKKVRRKIKRGNSVLAEIKSMRWETVRDVHQEEESI